MFSTLALIFIQIPHTWVLLRLVQLRFSSDAFPFYWVHELHSVPLGLPLPVQLKRPSKSLLRCFPDPCPILCAISSTSTVMPLRIKSFLTRTSEVSGVAQWSSCECHKTTPGLPHATEAAISLLRSYYVTYCLLPEVAHLV